ncbi:hypothetical protein CHLRE_17g724750v5 [Chlamydomonas reinhardtii]|uniref:EF-hand domain-containing protein n=1 Tax=Chlamydomonas reinhardtii TaxID=3055 RepID=A8J6L6_CHLRE|nr:uncharacterized protein CHLRE_17g724750v5 [Chlamydomonas reinhardtii]PNW70554.1 hypothetical protein CHLRE_17g724750v5 [Chlamydomonas reinhardtii]|eukprot:XP_001697147.1 hypothetical protein CHLREDRAFT_192488 [Chlamydomonas reinhardtii]
MGAGCSSDKQGPANGALKPSGSTNAPATAAEANQKRIEELKSQFVAEFPADDDAEELPTYADGSREATFLKVFALLDKASCSYLSVPQMKEYVLESGLSIEDFAKELAVIVAEQPDRTSNPKVTARQFVAAMVRLVHGFDDAAFAYFIAQTLQTHRAKGASQKKLEVTTDDVVEGVEGAVASPREA